MYTLKILQPLQQDFKSVSDHSGTVCMTELKLQIDNPFLPINKFWQNIMIQQKLTRKMIYLTIFTILKIVI